ncbi:MAG: thiamine phosphate synthase [Lachnospiraceae bacterium]|nr:thiamine phosphate synthase [Lachnospiraceae bacterium]
MLLKKRDMQLIAVADSAFLPEDVCLHDAVDRAIDGGASTILLRDHSLPEEDYMREAVRIKIMCGMHDVPFLIYGNIEAAEAVDADGIVVELKDFNSKEIRRKFGMDRSAGVMTNSVIDAVKAEKEGASFLLLGPISHKGKRKKKGTVNVEEVEEVCSNVMIPVVAYGGIADENLNDLRGTGIFGVGVGSSIFGSDDISEAAGSLRKLAIDVL